MKIEDLLSRGSQTRVKVIAGDLAPGNWELQGSLLRQPASTTTREAKAVELAHNIRRLDLKDLLGKDSFEPFVGAGIGALVGLRFFGLIGAVGGAVAGHWLTKDGPEVSITCELADGRKFIAVTHPSVYQTLRNIAATRPHYVDK